MLSVLLGVLVTAASAEKPKLVVLELVPGGVEASIAASLTDVVTAEVQRTGFFDVISTRDVQSLLGIERQKQLLGCDSTSCSTELSGALGARFVMNGTVVRLGDALQLTLTTLDAQKGTSLGRSTRLARSLEVLRAQLPTAVAEATATPLPTPPSRAFPVTLMAAGGAVALFGIVWGGIHLTQEQQLSAVLDTTGSTTGVLGSLASYKAQVENFRTQRWVAVGALGAGAVALAIGAVLFNVEPTTVALVPTGDGVAFVGVFP